MLNQRTGGESEDRAEKCAQENLQRRRSGRVLGEVEERALGWEQWH